MIPLRCVLAGSFLAAACARPPGVTPETVVLRGYGKEYTRAQFEEIARARNLNVQQAAARSAAAEGLARALAGAEEAKRRKLDQRPKVRARLEMYETALLNEALFDDVLAEIHKDESLARQRYGAGQHIAEERRVRHILIRHTRSVPVAGELTPEQARAKAEALRERIAAGASFTEVAKAESDDLQTKVSGGDLNFIRRPLLLPELGDAVFRMQEGEVSGPIGTTAGYHLILVEKIAPPPFELVRKSLEYELARERIEQISTQGVEMNPNYFGEK